MEPTLVAPISIKIIFPKLSVSNSHKVLLFCVRMAKLCFRAMGLTEKRGPLIYFVALGEQLQGK